MPACSALCGYCGRCTLAWEPPDEDRPPYRCTQCDWRGFEAQRHHRETAHAVRGARWPASWPDAVFACCAEHSHHLRVKP
jgi:hypothetical protein